LQAVVSLPYINNWHTPTEKLGPGGVRLWDTDTLEEHATPPQKPHRHGHITCIKWVTGPYDRYETICYGTLRGYLIFWRQDRRGWFEERWAHRIGQGEEILDISIDNPTKDEVRIAVGARCGSVQVWKYDCNGLLSNIFAVTIGETVPQKVAFTARTGGIAVFGHSDGYVYVCFACQQSPLKR
jgi:hypothetical protein